MRRTLGTGLVVALLVLATGCGKKADPPRSESLEGTWLLVQLEAGGAVQDKYVSAMPEGEKTIKITANQLTFPGGNKDAPLSYTLDSSKSPNEIDMNGTNPNGQSEKMYGVCKLEGDKLTICAAKSENPADRPKEFKTSATVQALLMVFEKK
ncbi:Uncharacterized protein OS=Singulisphaera acidiphila (strain ATCC BAA-1392 / DSM 18658 / VKM B-2454 / MOB10) GN=Sinac_5784 PE=4 SV=1 [Gemmata massiliana]|uniref:Lipocalin-like domain-containing protein n=1 Tax=Gemmata massiliana TaxID=1210884 RepID=A0A6P2DI53_9BACT|nr:TIGR03067 domain-containing protein [Gemmata massiliana]VTR99825.1 Uncharacterized protein OS=Singulisphaera acidiphila (strain ATCC BAA-1392 / DSM 18658 / VKM B-2454 / MOB10) GN=Sinac_5784 PE=4 SV=1 [Gemmata massiliana]